MFWRTRRLDECKPGVHLADKNMFRADSTWLPSVELADIIPKSIFNIAGFMESTLHQGLYSSMTSRPIDRCNKGGPFIVILRSIVSTEQLSAARR
jgi:hypothetical protein